MRGTRDRSFVEHTERPGGPGRVELLQILAALADTCLSAFQLAITVCSIGVGFTAEPLATERLEQHLWPSSRSG